jgi:hypothetical protein
MHVIASTSSKKNNAKGDDMNQFSKPQMWPQCVAAGYVETAPACGDCNWSHDEPQGLFCGNHLVLVHDNGRCKKWTPSDQWLRANPQVAYQYMTFGASLSLAELAYTYKDHTL